jgi:hypothetical protein
LDSFYGLIFLWTYLRVVKRSPRSHGGALLKVQGRRL